MHVIKEIVVCVTYRTSRFTVWQKKKKERGELIAVARLYIVRCMISS